MEGENTGRRILLFVLAIAVSTMLMSPQRLRAGGQSESELDNEYAQTNLVSNGFVKAMVKDANLVNPWGMIAGPMTPIWVSNQGTNTSAIYSINQIKAGKGALLTVMIPQTGTSAPQGPTGIVFNLDLAKMGFPIPGAKGGTVPSIFIFANLNGTIQGWNPGSTGGLASAVVAVDTPGAVYTGLTLGMVGSDVNLYAADFAPPPSGGIKAWDSTFHPAMNLVAHPFEDPHLPPLPANEVWAPYNVVNLNGSLFVAYDPMPAQGGLPIPGVNHGVIAEFTTKGEFVRNVAKHGLLNDPWGMAMAPDHFGRFSKDLLVGNFGDGKILAYRYHQGNFTFAGQLRGENHKPLENGRLWTLWFGNGVDGADPNTLYFTTGGPNQLVGLLGAITPDQDEK